MKHFILFGPPGAGKGTQAALMVDKYQLRHISTGDLLRREIKAGTELGRQAAALIEKGNLVPDEVVEGMIAGELAAHPDVKGFIFDGFPRTVAQAEVLDQMLADRGEAVTGVISVMIDDAMVLERIKHRALLENRKDDADEEIIRNRIANYHAKTEPVIGFYRAAGKYHEINGVGPIETIFERICEVID